MKTLSVSERMKKLTEANAVKDQLISFIDDSWGGSGQLETEEKVKGWVSNQFEKWVANPAVFGVSWDSAEEPVKEQVTIPEAGGKLPANLPDISLNEPVVEDLDETVNAVELPVSLPENEVFGSLLTDSWMKSPCFYNTLREMYDYYVGEYGQERGIDEFLDYAQSIRATGMESGMIDKEGRYIGGGYLQAAGEKLTPGVEGGQDYWGMRVRKIVIQYPDREQSRLWELYQSAGGGERGYNAVISLLDTGLDRAGYEPYEFEMEMGDAPRSYGTPLPYGTGTHYEDEIEVPGFGWVARDDIRPYNTRLPYGNGTHYEDEVEVPGVGWVARDKIRPYYGVSHLQAADASVVQTLTSLGPWGIAAIAAYLLGQGLAELAQKVQLGGSSSASITLTPEENQKVKEAISEMGSDLWAMSHPETMDWIKNNPPIARSVSEAYRPDVGVDDLLKESIKVRTGGDPNCNELEEMLLRLRVGIEEIGISYINFYEAWAGSMSDIELYEAMKNDRKNLSDEMNKVRKKMDDSGCGNTPDLEEKRWINNLHGLGAAYLKRR